MAIVRSEVSNYGSDTLPRDMVVNVVYHDVASTIFTDWSGPDWENHASQVAACFTGDSDRDPTFSIFRQRYVRVRCYDMADPEPRAPMADHLYTPSGGADPDSAFGVRQVALCLSFFPGRNLAGQRGRIYVGPYHPVDLTARPAAPLMTMVLNLGWALFDVGGENVHHVLHHQGIVTGHDTDGKPIYGTTQSGHTPGSTQVITDYWVDDSWDIIRRRKARPSSRLTKHP